MLRLSQRLVSVVGRRPFMASSVLRGGAHPEGHHDPHENLKYQAIGESVHSLGPQVATNTPFYQTHFIPPRTLQAVTFSAERFV